MIDLSKLKPVEIDINCPKVKLIIENTQKAIAKTIEQSKKNIRFPHH